MTSLFKLKIKTVSRQDAKTPRKSIHFVFSSVHPLRSLRLCVTSLFKLKIKTVSRQDAKKIYSFCFCLVHPLRSLRLCVTCLSNLKSKPFHAKTQRRQENLFFYRNCSASLEVLL